MAPASILDAIMQMQEVRHQGAWEQLEICADDPPKIPVRVAKVTWASLRGSSTEKAANDQTSAISPTDEQDEAPEADLPQSHKPDRVRRASANREWDANPKRLRSAVRAALLDRARGGTAGEDGWTVGLRELRKELDNLLYCGGGGGGDDDDDRQVQLRSLPPMLLYSISHPAH